MKHLFTLLLFGLCCSFLNAQYISEIDTDTPGTDAIEFIELTGTPGAAMTGFSLYLLNGSDDASYGCFDLSAETFPADGVFVLGSALVPNVDRVIFTTNGIQNGPEAVALVVGACGGNDTPCASIGTVLSSVIYDTNDADDAGLIACLGGVQINENANGDGANQSIQIAADGTVTIAAPTPGVDPNAPLCSITALQITSVVCSGDDAIVTGSFVAANGIGSYRIGVTGDVTQTMDFEGVPNGTVPFSITLAGPLSGTVDISIEAFLAAATCSASITGVALPTCPAVVVAPIPTMGQWTLFILALMMSSLALGFMFSVRRTKA